MTPIDPRYHSGPRIPERNRAELSEAQTNLLNQDIAIRYTQNNMLPSVALFGLYASSGLQGNTALLTGGAGDSLADGDA